MQSFTFLLIIGLNFTNQIKNQMKNFSFGFKSTSHMKKLFLLAFAIFSFAALRAQTVTIASELDSFDNPIYGDVVLFDSEESVPFFIIVDDNKPINCNKFKVKAFFKDYVNGTSENEYWVYQGEFDFPITPQYYGYWMQMNAFTPGNYRMEVYGYMNGTYQKYYGSSDFWVYSEDEYWDFGWW